MARSALYMLDETLGMLDETLETVSDDELDSGEDEIHEDPEFPLPHESDKESDSSTGSGGSSSKDGT